MSLEKRRILTVDKKKFLLEKNKNCYIFQQSLEGYSKEEIEFNHIYNYINGYPQELSDISSMA